MIENKTKTGGYWSAQVLEYDIATQAQGLTALLTEVQRVLNAHIQLSKKLNIEPFANLKSAPPVFWKMYYHRATTSVQPVSSVETLTNAPVEGRVAELQLC